MSNPNTITVHTDALKDALAWISKALPKRPAFPELGGIIASVKPGQMTLQAMDMKTACAVTIDAEVDAATNLLLHGQSLTDLAKNLPGDDVHLTVADSTVAVKSGPSRAKLTKMAADQHPGIPQPSEPQGEVDGTHFGAALLRVATAAEGERVQSGLETLKGVHIVASDGELRLEATDRYRVIVESIPWQPFADAAIDALVPAAVLTSFARALQGAGSVELSTSDKTGTFNMAIGARRATLPLMAEEFPEVGRFMDMPTPVTLTTDTESFRAAVRRMAAFSGTDAGMRMAIAEGQIDVSATDAREQAAEESVPAELDGEPFEAYFNPRLLVDVAAGVTTERIALSGTGPAKPLRINPVSDDGELLSHFQAIIMPRKF